MQNHILSIILFTPLVGALVLLFVPKENKDAIRWIANLFALGGFLISLPLVPMFWSQMQSPDRFKFIEGAPNNWIPSIGAGYVIGIGGVSRRLYAAIKFFLYTLAGSVLMLLGILFLYFHHHALTQVYTFSLTALYETAPKIYSDPAYGPTMATLLFFAFFFAFAIKVPMFPFHTWLPDAHVE